MHHLAAQRRGLVNIFSRSLKVNSSLQAGPRSYFTFGIELGVMITVNICQCKRTPQTLWPNSVATTVARWNWRVQTFRKRSRTGSIVSRIYASHTPRTSYPSRSSTWRPWQCLSRRPLFTSQPPSRRQSSYFVLPHAQSSDSPLVLISFGSPADYIDLLVYSMRCAR